MNTVLILSSILFLWLVWSYFWVNALNEFTRVQLIKLKRETNQWFEEKGYTSNHAANKQLQEELDSFIPYIEFFRLSSFLLFTKQNKRNKKSTKELFDEENFSQEIQTKIMSVKSSISAYLTWKMLLANMITFVLFLISFVVLLIISICSLVKNLIIGKCHDFSSSLIHGFIFTIFIGIISLPFISKANMQGYSDCITVKNIYKQKTV